MIFKGIATALITPFTNDGIDYFEFKKLIDFQINNNINGLVICGTTGEAATMSEMEYFSCIEHAIKYVDNKVPIIVGTGSNCTKKAAYITKKVSEMGVDGCLVVTPFYNKATQNGLYKHYEVISNSSSKPIILYNVPGRTGCDMLAETAAKIINDFPNVVGIKEASGDISRVRDILKLTNNADIYTGNDDMIFSSLSNGAIGGISVLSNIIPKETCSICSEYFCGNFEISKNLQKKYEILIKLLFKEVNPIPVKAAMKLLGYSSCNLRLPLTDIEECNFNLLKNELLKLEIING